MISFRDSVADVIKDSNFTNSQLITLVFANSNLTLFDNNILNGVYKGIKFLKNWNATITNSVFKNFVQSQSFLKRDLNRVNFH